MSNEALTPSPETPETPVATATRQKIPLTPAIIDLLKKELREQGLPERLYKWTFDGDEFVFRPLYGADQDAIDIFLKDNPNGMEAIHRKICDLALLFPDNIQHPTLWQIQRAGYESTLSRVIRAKSAFADPDIDTSELFEVEALGETQPGPKPDEKTITELKKKFNWPLKLVRIGDEWFVLRPLTHGEWKGLEGTPDADVAACDRAVVWSRSYPEQPDYTDRTLAGTVTMLSSIITRISGFTAEPIIEEL